MKSKPDDLSERRIHAALLDGWAFEPAQLEYAPVGAGSYHWFAVAQDGRRVFVTVDDLDLKGWLADDRESTFIALKAAFEAAGALASGQLPFVVAPKRARDGAAVVRLDERYALAVFPVVDGRVEESPPNDPAYGREVVSMLAELHLATSRASSVARTSGVALPGRVGLERALSELDVEWSGGPYSERARLALRRSTTDLEERIAHGDALAASIEERNEPFVITHGEPHHRNVLRTRRGLVLVDWDTVSLAPPERDLWMLVERADDELASAYASRTGRRVDQDALDFFRLAWDLGDTAEYVNALRSVHTENDDTRRALASLER